MRTNQDHKTFLWLNQYPATSPHHTHPASHASRADSRDASRLTALRYGEHIALNAATNPGRDPSAQIHARSDSRCALAWRLADPVADRQAATRTGMTHIAQADHTIPHHTGYLARDVATEQPPAALSSAMAHAGDTGRPVAETCCIWRNSAGWTCYIFTLRCSVGFG